MNIFNQQKLNDHINALLTNCSKMVMHINAFAHHEEIEEQKKRSKQKKLPYTYNRKCRELNGDKDLPKDINPVVRFKSKIEGTSTTKRLSSRRC